jgi:3-hydroxyisobutyrate dehydrogenase-like beta-hydroxyacid dehydrogenase
MANHSPVGVIGLGLLGSVLAARLTGAGIPVTGFDIDSRRRAVLKDLGGQVATSAAQVMTRCQTIVVAVFNAGEIELLFDELGRKPHLAGAVMICTTTCAPEDVLGARDFAPQSHIAQTLKDSELILEEARQQEQHLPMTLIQTGLLRSAITLVRPEADSSAVIEAIRPSKAKPRGRR